MITTRPRTSMALPVLLAAVAIGILAGVVATRSWAGLLDGSACDDAELAKEQRRLCRMYCDTRRCAEPFGGSVSPACGRLLHRYTDTASGTAPPCDVVPSGCRLECLAPAWPAERQCRAAALLALGECGGSNRACEAAAAATLSRCLAAVRTRYADCLNGCDDVDACSQPRDAGRCHATLPRWAYDAEAARCVPFVWGGCGGNANNFETQAACLRTCAADVCRLPPDPGPCEAAIPRWYFDRESGTCKPFTFGGCAGNANNFTSFEECSDACASRNPCEDVRCLPHQECRVYDPTGEAYCADSCDRMECPVGTACRLEEVQCVRAPCPPVARCVPQGDCGLPVDPGPCDGAFLRWYFDANSSRCVEFIYGGCGGNSNNFETIEKCQAACTGCQPPDPRAQGTCEP